MFNKKPLQIKRTTVKVKASPKPGPTPTPQAPIRTVPKPSKPKPLRVDSTKNTSERDRDSPAISTKRKKPQRPTSSTPDFGKDDSSSDDNDSFLEDRSKRQKTDPLQLGLPTREVRDKEAFAEDALAAEELKEEDGEEFYSIPKGLVQAAHIPRLDQTTKYETVFEGEENLSVHVRFPVAYRREWFKLIKPVNDSQGYESAQDIAQTMHKIIAHFFPESERDQLDNESTGLPQRLLRAIHKKSVLSTREVIQDWNDTIVRLYKDGSIAKTLDAMGSVAPDLAERIINQTFSRTVSLNLKYLHQYEAGTDNVYGELLPKFVSQILRDVRATKDMVFVDLGSGVGNVVLQVALEAGCESWGCEMMEKYCDVAEIQETDFRARCQMWGLAIGKTRLEKGDFMANTKIHEALRRADIVLVNNQVFTPALNEALSTLFLDLKDGAKIVSLRSFVPAGHKIKARNAGSVLNLLKVEQKEYFSQCVSWTDQGGKYFISTKDSSAMTEYYKKHGS